MSWGYFLSKQFLPRLQGKVLILAYHRVLSEKELKKDFVQPGMYVRNDIFEKQMQFLRDYFEVIPFAELLQLWNKNLLDHKKRYCVITFDDGWLDNYTYAYPILKRYHLPATIFLPTNFIGTNEWFWPDRVGYLLNRCIETAEKELLASWWAKYPSIKSEIGDNEKIDSFIEAYKQLPEEEIKVLIEEMERALGISSPLDRLVINWEEVEEMSLSRISFGSHSATHKILTKLSREEIQTELEVSYKALQREKINILPVFCYPNGGVNHTVSEQVRKAGYQAAVTTRFGFEAESPTNLFELKRIGVHHDISATVPLFSWHLSGMNHLLSQ